MVEVDVKRLSNSKDRIPLMISERLIDVTKDYTGEYHYGKRTVPVLQPA